jgi:hypothetical protein
MGRGSLRGNLYQAKVNKINGANKAVQVAQKFVEQSLILSLISSD